MSGKAGSAIGIALGVVLVATGWGAPAGGSILWGQVASGALMIGAGIYGMTFSPGAEGPGTLRARDVEFATSAEGQPVPIVFGTRRVVGNFMYYSKDQLRTVAIKGKKPKGDSLGGGKAPTVGHDYHLYFEYGICMGPIDRISEVWSTPGEVAMMQRKTGVGNTSYSTYLAASFQQPASAGTVSADVVSASNLSIGQEIQFGTEPRARYTIANIAGTTLTLTPASIPSVAFWVIQDVKVFPKVPAVGGTVRVAFDGTSGFSEGDTLEVPSIGVATVLTKHDATSATLTIVSASNEGYVQDLRAVNKNISQDVIFDADREDFELASEKEGGQVRVYRGTATQERFDSADPYYSSGMNYRNICWALFQNFKIGQSPTVKSYGFVVSRLPRVLDDDGNDLTASGFKVRGSDDPAHASYWEANPAAIVWEIFVNKIWGRGISSTLLDQQSFIDASAYFAEDGHGMSFVVDSAVKVTELVEGILSQVKTILVSDNGKLKMRVLLDPGELYQSVKTIRKSQIDKVEFGRPDWNSTFNEVRAEYDDRDRNYRPSTVVAHSLANFDIVQTVNQQRISLTGFTHHELAHWHANRILEQVSYPAGTLSFEINRFGCDLEPGDVFRIIWDEWSENPVTGYFQVTSVGPGDSTNEAIKVTALEDMSVSFAEGEETSLATPPNQGPWWFWMDNPVSKGGTYTNPSETITSIEPSSVFEMPALATRGLHDAIFITGEKASPEMIGIVGKYSESPYTTFKTLDTLDSFSITGTMLTDYAAGPAFDRSAAGFQFTLTSTDNEGDILTANTVSSDADNFEDLIASEESWLFVDEEILQVGLIEKLGANQYRARNIIRGLYGTKIAPHYKNHRIFYSEDIPVNFFNADDIPAGEEIAFRGTPVTPAGEKLIGGNLFVTRLDSENDKVFLGIGRRPLAPEPRTASLSGNIFSIQVRPRFADKGAGIGSLGTSMKRLITSLGKLSFFVEAIDGTGAVLDKSGVSILGGPATLMIQGDPTAPAITAYGRFVPDSLSSAETGVFDVDYELPSSISPASVKMIKVYASLEGRDSIDAAQFSF